MGKKIVYSLCGLALLASIVCTVVIYVATGKLRNEHVDMITEYEDRINEIEQSPDVIEYVEEIVDRYEHTDLTYDNLKSKIRVGNISPSALEYVIALMLEECNHNSEWLVETMSGYCEVFQLSHESGVCSKIYRFAGDYLVAYVPSSNVYDVSHNGEFVRLYGNTVQAAAELLCELDTWNWNNQEAALLIGKAELDYPNVKYGMSSRGLMFEDGSEFVVNNGAVKYILPGETTGTLYSPYANLLSAAQTDLLIDQTNWAPAKSLNIVAVIEVLEENELPICEDSLVEIFTEDLPSMLSSWTYSIVDGVITVSTVELDSTYIDSKHEIQLFWVDTSTGEYATFY